MPNFTKIAEGLEIGPALAEIAATPDHWWLDNRGDGCANLYLLDHRNAPILRDELPETWRLIERARRLLAADHHDRGALSFCRVGRMPPGAGMAPHRDGIDGVIERRYQLALQSVPGVEFTVGGEMRCPCPGDLWQIAVHHSHSVWNRSPVDRITLLFDTRQDSGAEAAP